MACSTQFEGQPTGCECLLFVCTDSSTVEMALQQQQHLAPVGQQHTSLHSAFHNHNLRRTSVFHRKRRLHVCLATAAGAGVGDSSEQPSSSAAPSHSSLPPEKPGGPLQWLRQRFSSSKIDKQKLAEYGLGGLLLAVLTMHAGLLSLGQARHDHALPAGVFAMVYVYVCLIVYPSHNPL